MKRIIVISVTLLALAMPWVAEAKKYRSQWGRAPILKSLERQGLSTNVRVVWTGDSYSHKSSQFLVQNVNRTDIVYSANVLKKTGVARVRTPTRAVTVRRAEFLATALRRANNPGAGQFVKRRRGPMTADGNYKIKSATDRNEYVKVWARSKTLTQKGPTKTTHHDIGR